MFSQSVIREVQAGKENSESSSGNKSSGQAVIAFMPVWEATAELIGDFSRKIFVGNCASRKMCKHRSYCQDMRELDTTADNAMAGGKGMRSKYVGTVKLMCQVGDTFIRITRKYVTYIPSARTNLISLTAMQKVWLEGEYPMDVKNYFLNSRNQVVMVGSSIIHLISELRGVNLVTGGNEFKTSYGGPTGGKFNIELLHGRLKHVDYDAIKEMIKHNVVDVLHDA